MLVLFRLKFTFFPVCSDAKRVFPAWRDRFFRTTGFVNQNRFCTLSTLLSIRQNRIYWWIRTYIILDICVICRICLLKVVDLWQVCEEWPLRKSGKSGILIYVRKGCIKMGTIGGALCFRLVIRFFTAAAASAGSIRSQAGNSETAWRIIMCWSRFMRPNRRSIFR